MRTEKKWYEARFLYVHQADSGSWLVDYAPGDPAEEKCLCVCDTRAEAEAERQKIIAQNYTEGEL